MTPPVILGVMTFCFLFFGYLGVPVAFSLMAGVFIMSATFKVLGMGATVGYVAAVGFPFPLFLAWVAAFFEAALAVALLTGATGDGQFAGPPRSGG